MKVYSVMECLATIYRFSYNLLIFSLGVVVNLWDCTSRLLDQQLDIITCTNALITTVMRPVDYLVMCV